ncbi:hypothetical protein HHK36_010434 [Tetracentron sinense]|uniref:SBP-type domain-containing protein n=1 Tax=Tetracentron sinense TaxID=13715 RepID=A0A835DMD4_TETSI|nr:hypothetical protein HHK36_010434 [Tetracentron sinense]
MEDGPPMKIKLHCAVMNHNSAMEEINRERKVVSPVSSQSISCVANNCDCDLSSGKRYHRRHKVCERHDKAAIVLIGSVDQRYCQQCSRFHEISQFDNTKRSCRKRLAGHNERRRKTHPDIQAEDAGLKPPIPNMKESLWRATGLPEHIQMTFQRNANFKHFQIR